MTGFRTELVLSLAATIALAAPASAQITHAQLEARQAKYQVLERQGAPREIDSLSYAKARERAAKLGFDPLPILARNGDPCIAHDDYCERWPEVETCSAGGDCIFYWRSRKDGRLLLVQTEYTRRGPTVMDARWGQRADLCNHTFARGLAVQALPNLVPPVDPRDPCGPSQDVR